MQRRSVEFLLDGDFAVLISAPHHLGVAAAVGDDIGELVPVVDFDDMSLKVIRWALLYIPLVISDIWLTALAAMCNHRWPK